jgi:mgtE-like transporter
LLVLVPALLATRGNVYGALGARLATGLHQGVLSPDVSLADERLRRAVTAAMANGVFVSGVAALVAVAALAALGRPVAPPARLVAIALVAGLLSGVLLTVAVVTVVVAGFRRGHDPDTLVGPIVTTTGDVFGLACLVAAVWLVEVVA